MIMLILASRRMQAPMMAMLLLVAAQFALVSCEAEPAAMSARVTIAGR